MSEVLGVVQVPKWFGKCITEAGGSQRSAQTEFKFSINKKNSPQPRIHTHTSQVGMELYLSEFSPVSNAYTLLQKHFVVFSNLWKMNSVSNFFLKSVHFLKIDYQKVVWKQRKRSWSTLISQNLKSTSNILKMLNVEYKPYKLIKSHADR